MCDVWVLNAEFVFTSLDVVVVAKCSTGLAVFRIRQTNRAMVKSATDDVGAQLGLIASCCRKRRKQLACNIPPCIDSAVLVQAVRRDAVTPCVASLCNVYIRCRPANNGRGQCKCQPAATECEHETQQKSRAEAGPTQESWGNRRCFDRQFARPKTLSFPSEMVKQPQCISVVWRDSGLFSSTILITLCASTGNGD